VSIETVCKVCGRTYVASREEIFAGPSWRLRPACRKDAAR
jgi:hypothetical protein